MAPKNKPTDIFDLVREEIPEIQNRILEEPHISMDSFNIDNGVIGKAIHLAKLETFLTSTPHHIYPVPIIEFFGNLNEQTKSTSISCLQNPDRPNLRVSTPLRLSEVTDALGLRSTGSDVESAGSDDLTVMLRRFSEDANAVYVPGKIHTKCLKPIFKKLCDTVTKILFSHVGSHTSVTKSKLRVLCALMDELQGKEYNWAKFVISQWFEVAAKEVQRKGPFIFSTNTTIRYGNAISVAMLRIQETKGSFFDSRFSFVPSKRSLYKENEDEVISDRLVVAQIELPGAKNVALPVKKQKQNKRAKQPIVEEPEEKDDEDHEPLEHKRRRLQSEPALNVEPLCTYLASELDSSEDEEEDTEEEDTEEEREELGVEEKEVKSEAEKEVGAETQSLADSLLNVNVAREVSALDISALEKFAREASALALQAALDKGKSILENTHEDEEAELGEEDNMSFLEGEENLINFGKLPDDEDLLEGLDNLEIPTASTGGGSQASLIALEKRLLQADINRHFANVELSAEMKESFSELLGYARIRGTEFYKIFIAEDEAGREPLKKTEAKILSKFGFSGFHELVDDGAAWQKMEEALLPTYPNIRSLVPVRVPSVKELLQIAQESKYAIEVGDAKVKELVAENESLKAKLEEVEKTAEARLAVLQSSIQTLNDQLIEATNVQNSLSEELAKTNTELALQRSLSEASEEETRKLLEEKEALLAAKELPLEEKENMMKEREELKADIEHLIAKAENILAPAADEFPKPAQEEGISNAQIQEAVEQSLQLGPHVKAILSEVLRKQVPQFAHLVIGHLLLQMEKGMKEVVKKDRAERGVGAGGPSSGHVSKGEGSKNTLPVAPPAKGIVLKEHVPSTSQQPLPVRSCADVSARGKQIISAPALEFALESALDQSAQDEPVVAESVVAEPVGETAQKKKKTIKRKLVMKPDAPAPKKAKTAAQKPSIERAKIEKAVNEEFRARVKIHLKEACIRYVPQNPEERDAMKIYAEDLVASLLIAEIEKNQKDDDAREFVCSVIQGIRPKLNSEEIKATYPDIKERIFSRSAQEIRRFLEEHYIKDVEEYVPERRLDEWKKAEIRFIKMHYYWGIYKTRNPQNAFVDFMRFYYKSLWSLILLSAGDHLMKVPAKRILERPYIQGSIVVDRQKIENEWLWVVNTKGIKENETASTQARINVYAAYGLTPSG